MVLTRRNEMSAMTMPVLFHSGGALIASPSSTLREQVVHRLNGRCRPVQQALGGADALARLEKGGWQILFLDRRLPDLDAEELFAIIQKRFPGIQVVLLDSSAGFSADNLEKVRESDANRSGATTARGTAPEGSWQSGETLESEPLPGMIGRSEAMQRVY